MEVEERARDDGVRKGRGEDGGGGGGGGNAGRLVVGRGNGQNASNAKLWPFIPFDRVTSGDIDSSLPRRFCG